MQGEGGSVTLSWGIVLLFSYSGASLLCRRGELFSWENVLVINSWNPPIGEGKKKWSHWWGGKHAVDRGVLGGRQGLRSRGGE